MGIQLIRIAGEQIRWELGSARKRIACDEPQKQELIDALCCPKESLLKSAKTAINLACINSRLSAAQTSQKSKYQQLEPVVFTIFAP